MSGDPCSLGEDGSANIRTKKYMMDCVHNGSTWKVKFCEIGMYQ